MCPHLERFSARAIRASCSSRQNMSFKFTAGKFAAALLVLACSVGAAPAEQGWWMTEPIRWIQTNLPETDAALNPQKFVSQAAEYDANVLLMTMGGISAYYPSRVHYHYVS